MQPKPKSTEPFEIYSASAGSGKTYQLARTYLTLLLRPQFPQAYRSLLAITFTNKATNEMKQRILDSLYDFGFTKVPKKSESLFKEVGHALSLSDAALQKSSQRVLKDLLHNYSFFGVATIDRFNHRLIRTFAQDLKIAQGFEVVLGDELQLLLEEAVGRLLSEAGNNEQLTQVLLDFSMGKIDQDKSWNIAHDLREIGQLLFKETHHGQLSALRKKRLDNFLNVQNLLRQRVKSLETKTIENANQALALIAQAGLEAADFYRGQFPAFMKSLQQAKGNINFNAAWKQNIENTPFYTKNSEAKALIDAIRPELIQLFLAIKDNFETSSFLQNALGHIIPLALINEINKKINEIKKERSLLPISEFNTLISKEIKNQPTPFIYERLGEKYRHYFIDEFQDTSQMQWQNLVPLISNALESENEKGESGSLFLVGDAKQAIYRWRAGNVEQFLDLLFATKNPFSIPSKTKELKVNWRSDAQIVHFNNHFFIYIAEKLKNPNYRELYLSGNAQEAHKKDAGYVQLNFLDSEDDNSVKQCATTLELVHQICHKGYNFKDICILVRDNKKATVLADFLAQNNIPVISPDALLLANNDKINFLVAFLRHLIDPSDKNALYDILSFLAPETDQHGFVATYLDAPYTFWNDFDIDFQGLSKRSTYTIVEWAIAHFKLQNGSDAYLYQFMDMVFEITSKKGGGILNVLRHWEAKKEQLAVSAPENLNAVQLMTIHKAKGLEFPVVIFPFADAKIIDARNLKIWVPQHEIALEGFEKLLFSYNRSLLVPGTKSEETYLSEQEKLELDAYNVLYVAMTRAKKALFVLCSKNTKRSTGETDGTYSGLFMNYLSHLGLWNNTQEKYDFGTFSAPSIEEKTPRNVRDIPHIFRMLPKSYDRLDKKNLEAHIEQAQDKGTLFHQFMAEIETDADLEEAIHTVKAQTKLDPDEVIFLRETFQKISTHPILRAYYQNGGTVYNEKDVLHPKVGILRPDRIVIKNKKATIIDYKTGKEISSHENQIKTYREAVADMGFQIENSILVYVDPNGVTAKRVQ